MSRHWNSPARQSVVIYGRGLSRDWQPPFPCIVIRLKRDPLPCDYRAARSLVFQGSEPFWHYDDPPKWVRHFRQYSDAKPSTGLCAVFMALDRLNVADLYLPGFDNLLDARPMVPHDMAAESRCLRALGVPIIDVRADGNFSRL